MDNDDILNLKIDLETLSVDTFLDKYSPPINLSGKRYAYTIVVESVDGDGNYIPCIAVENESGYYPMSGRGSCSVPWKWGKDYKVACEIADRMNERMGLTRVEAYKIITSSMFCRG